MNTPNNTKWNELQSLISKQDFLSSSNTVVLLLNDGRLTPKQGVEVLRQYFYLVVTIVQFLTIAMAKIPVAKAKEELWRNLGEELGSRTGGVSHQELLEKLLSRELEINVRTGWNVSTERFICELLLNFHLGSPRFVAGMIYALEATACPELLVVAEIINLAAQKEVVDISKLRGESSEQLGEVTTLQGFLAAHTLDFELGHESGLRSTLEEFAAEDWKEFENGFSSVLYGMRIWWTHIFKA